MRFGVAGWVGRTRGVWVALVALPLAASLLGACGLTGAPGSANGQVIPVVAAENFWGSVAAQVGGARVEVLRASDGRVAVIGQTDDTGREPHGTY
jgi:zinc/manganese transport system substrate-binding protein